YGAVLAAGGQPLRRPRAGLVLERHQHRRAHRHALRRPGALGHRAGRRGRVPGPGGQPDRARGGAGLQRPGRGRPGLPARGGAHQAVGGRPRPAARAGLDAVPDRLGCSLGQPAGVPQRQRHRAAHPRRLGGVRALAGRRGAGHGHRGRDGRHRRRDGALVRPALPLPLRAARGGQVRPHPAAEPGPAAGHRRGRRRRPAADRRRLWQPGPGAGPRRARVPSSLMLVSEAVAAALTDLGTDTVFGLVGSGNFHVTNALISRGARFIAARHEGGAASMADGWARLSGRPGVVSLHQGPGLTNALTAIAEAAKSRTPMVVLAADASAPRSNFRIDVAAIAAGVGATPARLHSAGFAVDDAIRAYRTAASERRCVVLALPLEVQAGECTWPGVGPAPTATGALEPSAGQAKALAGLLERAERPVFIAGRGARAAGPQAAAELQRLASACGALLATSAAARGLFRGSPWDLDVSGGFASPLAAELIQGADLVVGWGCSLNMWTLRHGALIGPGAAVVQVDTDASAIGAHQRVSLGVTGDVAATARAVAGLLPDAEDTGGYRS